jgi:hypothetical protein
MIENMDIDWDWACPKKVLSRRYLVDFWRKWTGLLSIPEGTQYWTMCGKCCSGGKVIPWHEYDHLVHKEALLVPKQWWGVDISRETYLENSSLGQGSWILGDFRMAMVEAESAGEYRPAFVNADTTFRIRKAVSYMADLMALISRQSQEVVLATNIVMYHKLYMKERTKPGEVAELLGQEPSYRLALANAEWEFPTWPGDDQDQWAHYEYDGTDSLNGKSASTMATFIAVKLPR